MEDVGSKMMFLEASLTMLRDLGAKMANKNAKIRPLGGSSEAGWRVWGSLGEPKEASTGEHTECPALVTLFG